MTLTTLDIFNLVASISSIILAVLAIVLSVVFYFASKNAEVKSTIALNNIEQATNTINTVSMKLLNKLANYVTSPNPTEQSLIAMITSLQTVAPLKDTDELPNNPTKAQLDQFRVDNLIAALFYAAISNTSLQAYIPNDISQIDNASGIVPLVDQSKQDYITLKSWILASDAIRLTNSPVKHMYDQALALETEIKNVTEVYASKQNPTV